MRNGPIPYITIEGTVFEIDVERQVLAERANPENTISFIDQMVDHGTHYTVLYDPELKNEFDRLAGSEGSDGPSVIRVPKLIELDPEGMAERYGCTVAGLQGKTDAEVIVDQELLARRLGGALPVIDICGASFYVDVRLQELRSVEEHWNRIDLRSLDIAGEKENYLALYHPESRQIVHADLNMTALPEGVVMIEIPKDLELDPVAVARQYGMEQHELLRRYPIQKDLRAQSFPLSETGLPALVEMNLKKQEEAKLSQNEAPRIRTRPKF